ncbi:hypothetical protein OAY25_03210 [Candidatus Pelagibacter sp.]|nr:hypothetical protein [Candidatus Pelagibacter sp.]
MKKLTNVSGVTLIEILLGIVISVIMMGAMLTSYNVVNNSYSQVTDKAKISNQGKVVLGMIMADIRNAGFKYYGDTVKTTNEHVPILITKASNFNTACDTIDIVYGDMKYDEGKTPKYTFERYKVTYSCERSKLPDKNAPPLPGNKFPPINAFAVYKTKVIWDETASNWKNPRTDGNNATYEKQLVADYIEDLVFLPIDDEGKLIDPPPTTNNATKDKLYKIKTVDIALSIRSTKKFYRSDKDRTKFTLNNPLRKKTRNDKYFRETIVVTAHARNMGTL